MSEQQERIVDPQDAVDFMLRHAEEYAKAEGYKVYCEELRKTIKAELMKEAELDGHKTAAMQEREAYAHPLYRKHLEKLQGAVIDREKLRWKLIAAQARIEVWRSQEASNRKIERATL
jgi:hypothetical protein